MSSPKEAGVTPKSPLATWVGEVSRFADTPKQMAFEFANAFEIQIPKVDLLLIAYFAPSRSPVSVEVDHPFRSKPITRFGASRSPVSLEADHPFRLMAITR
jgi:hypothetical protein